MQTRTKSVLIGVGACLAVGGAIYGGMKLIEPDWTTNAPCESFDTCIAHCDAGDAYGCFEAGRILYDGEYQPRDVVRGRDLIEKGCDGGSYQACDRLAGIVFEDKQRAHALKQRSFELTQRACDERNLDGCTSLVYDFKFGWDADTDEGKDEASADALISRILPVHKDRCHAGDARSCWKAARLSEGLGGEPPRENLEKALPFYERWCRLDPTSCWELSSAERKAGRPYRESIEKACEASDDGSSCWDPNAENDRDLLTRRMEKATFACQHGKRKACLDLVFLPRGAASLPREDRVAGRAVGISAIQNECDRGLGDSCDMVASALGLDVDGELARGQDILTIAVAHEKGCAAGYEHSCFSRDLTPIVRDVDALYTEAFHSCAKRGDKLSCWGVGEEALGAPDGTKGIFDVPLSAPVTSAVALSSGTCALLANHDVYCWGDDLFWKGGRTPARVDALHGALAIKGYEREVCGLFPDRRATCIGQFWDRSTPLELTDVDDVFPFFYATCWLPSKCRLRMNTPAHDVPAAQSAAGSFPRRSPFRLRAFGRPSRSKKHVPSPKSTSRSVGEGDTACRGALRRSSETTLAGLERCRRRGRRRAIGSPPPSARQSEQAVGVSACDVLGRHTLCRPSQKYAGTLGPDTFSALHHSWISK